MSVRSPLRQAQSRTPLVVVAVGVVTLGAMTFLIDPVRKQFGPFLSNFFDLSHADLGAGVLSRTIVSVTPGQDTNFHWNDVLYADGRVRRIRFERRTRTSTGLSAARKIVTDFDIYGRTIQEQDGTQDGRNLNVYRFAYPDANPKASFSERHDIYIFYDGSAETANQYVGIGTGTLAPGRTFSAGTYSGFLAEFLAVPERPEVTPPAAQKAPSP